MRSWNAIASIFLAGMLSVPMLAAGNPNFAGPPMPGTVNYVEGQVSIGNQTVNPSAIGKTQLQAGEVLTTGKGRAEILLSPGVILRTDNNSALRMDTPELATTTLTLQRGRALVEAPVILPENDIEIQESGASARLMKKGLYEFDAEHGQLRVFDGEMEVKLPGKTIKVKAGHQLDLQAAGKMKARDFDKKADQDDFYRWASLRSSFLANANLDAARTNGPGQPGWYGTGWYWDPWYSAYTWIPGDGFFYSPFGWGFYSPWYAFYGAPLGYFGYGGYYHGGVHRFGGYHGGFAGGMHNGFHGGGYHGFAGGGGFHGGGFHGGGGFGGGFHGGGGGHR